MDVMHFDYKGITVTYDRDKFEDECWHLTIDGQDRSFRIPKYAREHIDKYQEYAKNIGKVIYSVSKRWEPEERKYYEDTIERHIVTGTYYHDVDDGESMGLFLIDENGDKIDTYAYFTDEAHVDLLREMMEHNKRQEAFWEEGSVLYKKINDASPINDY